MESKWTRGLQIKYLLTLIFSKMRQTQCVNRTNVTSVSLSYQLSLYRPDFPDSSSMYILGHAFPGETGCELHLRTVDDIASSEGRQATAHPDRGEATPPWNCMSGLQFIVSINWSTALLEGQPFSG